LELISIENRGIASAVWGNLKLILSSSYLLIFLSSYLLNFFLFSLVPMLLTYEKHTLIKSFAGDSKGGGFSKESPLAAGGKKSSFRVLIGFQDGHLKSFLVFMSIL
jgi:hypothetical protein